MPCLRCLVKHEMPRETRDAPAALFLKKFDGIIDHCDEEDYDEYDDNKYYEYDDDYDEYDDEYDDGFHHAMDDGIIRQVQSVYNIYVPTHQTHLQP